MATEGRLGLLSLPAETIANVASYLRQEDLCKFVRTCRHVWRVARGELFVYPQLGCYKRASGFRQAVEGSPEWAARVKNLNYRSCDADAWESWLNGLEPLPNLLRVELLCGDHWWAPHRPMALLATFATMSRHPRLENLMICCEPRSPPVTFDHPVPVLGSLTCLTLTEFIPAAAPRIGLVLARCCPNLSRLAIISRASESGYYPTPEAMPIASLLSLRKLRDLCLVTSDYDDGSTLDGPALATLVSRLRIARLRLYGRKCASRATIPGELLDGDHADLATLFLALSSLWRHCGLRELFDRIEPSRFPSLQKVKLMLPKITPRVWADRAGSSCEILSSIDAAAERLRACGFVVHSCEWCFCAEKPSSQSWVDSLLAWLPLY